MKPKKDTKQVRVTFFASKVSTGRGSGFWLDTSVGARLVGPPDQNHVGVFSYDLAHYFSENDCQSKIFPVGEELLKNINKKK